MPSTISRSAASPEEPSVVNPFFPIKENSSPIVTELSAGSILVPMRQYANRNNETPRPEAHLRYGTIRYFQRFHGGEIIWTKR